VAIIDPRHAAKQLVYERIFRTATLMAAVLVLVILGGVAISLLRGAWPALRHFGFSFVTREIWNPVTDEFGALAPIYGTVVTSLIAMVIAVPTGFGIALFLTELCPPMLKHHLWHLGIVRAGAGAATTRAALADRARSSDPRHR
jgi:phosphate transport system permease protein